MTPVCEIGNGGISTYAHLCARHQSDRRGAGWWVKPNDRHASGPCDDCVRDEQLADGYVTPTVAFETTRAEARLPTRKESPRPKPPETWAARLARLRASQQPHAVEAA